MSLLSKLNFIRPIQHWIDTRAGQTFMQYTYSWGAAVVILGTLFKLTHIAGANFMLFVGMGTEVFVFFISGFERPFDRIQDNDAAKANLQQQPQVAPLTEMTDDLLVIDEPDTNHDEAYAPQVDTMAATDTDVPAHNDEEPIEQPIVDPVQPIVEPVQPTVEPVQPVANPAAMAASAVAASLAAAGQAAAEAQLALSQMNSGGMATQQSALDTAAIDATNPSEIHEAVNNYADELRELTDVISRVRDQLSRMTTDSEEMENLNRTLTGISTVYELQLKTVSKQVVTIEQIDEQTRRMAVQIEELNNIYSRMIKALTVNAEALKG